MARIPIEEAQDGMVLEDPVTNANGKVLLAAGSTLSDKHLRAMKMWGIADIAVKTGDEAEQVDEIDPATLEHAKSAISAHFIHTDLEHPIMDEIFKQAAIRYAKRK